MTIKVKKLKENARLPYRATERSAGFDLYACLDGEKVIAAGESALIPVGIAAEIPAGYGGFLFPRSSLALKYSVTMSNCVGVIDSDYRGEISVPLINHGHEPYTVKSGERIGQLVILETPSVKYEFVSELDETQRGEGGFGSTGK